MKGKQKVNVKKLEKALHEEREQLQTQLDSNEIEPSLLSGDSADMSAHLTDEHISMAMTERALKRIAEIDETLRRINLPNFGECLECGDDIEAKRLMLVPSARLCVDCQHKLERNR